MFRSRNRSIIVPQAEHARFAGAIAYLWGNDAFAPPELDPNAFALGVAIHDRGYGELDAAGIGEADAATWLAMQRAGLAARHPDPIVDTIALTHIRRLVSGKTSPAAQELVREFDEVIAENVARTGLDHGAFETADSITAVCDSISFLFCFEERSSVSREVVVDHTTGATRTIEIAINDGGEVRLRPWPLAVREMTGFLIAYHETGYPGNPTPILLPYSLR